jgi:hypothetical protein
MVLGWLEGFEIFLRGIFGYLPDIGVAVVEGCFEISPEGGVIVVEVEGQGDGFHLVFILGNGEYGDLLFEHIRLF